MRVKYAVPLILMALALSACGGEPGGITSEPDANGRTVALPDSFGEFVAHDQRCERVEQEDMERCLANTAQVRGVNEAAAANVSTAYDGAAAVARGYEAQEGLYYAVVYLVAGGSPGLWSRQASEEWVTRAGVHGERTASKGNAVCILTTNDYVYTNDDEPPADAWVAHECSASDGRSTALVSLSGGVPEAMALDLTLQALASA